HLPAPKKSRRGPLHRATPSRAPRRGQVDSIRRLFRSPLATIGSIYRQREGSGTGDAERGGPAGCSAGGQVPLADLTSAKQGRARMSAAPAERPVGRSPA